MYARTTRNSMGQFLRSREYFVHVSKPLENKHIVLAPEKRDEFGAILHPEVAFDIPVVTKEPGVTRFTNRAAWERSGKRGVFHARPEDLP
jgi:hypothetical protein